MTTKDHIVKLAGEMDANQRLDVMTEMVRRYLSLPEQQKFVQAIEEAIKQQNLQREVQLGQDDIQQGRLSDKTVEDIATDVLART